MWDGSKNSCPANWLTFAHLGDAPRFELISLNNKKKPSTRLTIPSFSICCPSFDSRLLKQQSVGPSGIEKAAFGIGSLNLLLLHLKTLLYNCKLDFSPMKRNTFTIFLLCVFGLSHAEGNAPVFRPLKEEIFFASETPYVWDLYKTMLYTCYQRGGRSLFCEIMAGGKTYVQKIILQ
jgi:hypothetical protein